MNLPTYLAGTSSKEGVDLITGHNRWGRTGPTHTLAQLNSLGRTGRRQKCSQAQFLSPFSHFVGDSFPTNNWQLLSFLTWVSWTLAVWFYLESFHRNIWWVEESILQSGKRKHRIQGFGDWEILWTHQWFFSQLYCIMPQSLARISFNNSIEHWKILSQTKFSWNFLDFKCHMLHWTAHHKLTQWALMGTKNILPTPE